MSLFIKWFSFVQLEAAGDVCFPSARIWGEFFGFVLETVCEDFRPLPNNKRRNFMFSEVSGYHGAVLRGLEG